MIECIRCKAANPAFATHCQQCGADLLPSHGRTNRIVVIVSGVIGALVLGVPAILILRLPRVASGNAPEPATWLAYGMLLGAGLFLAFALYSFRKIPEAVRSAMQVHEQVESHPEQAFADVVKSLETKSTNLNLWKSRAYLRDRLNLGIDDLLKEIAATETALAKDRGKVGNELAMQVVTLYEKVIAAFQRAGKADEATRHHLRLLDFSEKHVDDMMPFRTQRAGFGTGVTLARRSELRKQLQEQRRTMHEAGIVKAVAYCPDCARVVQPDVDLHCPDCGRRKKLSDLRYVVPDDVDAAVGAILWKYPGAGQK